VALMGEYAAALGVRFLDEDFYDPTAGTVMIRHLGPQPPRAFEVSLDDARRARDKGLH